MGYVLTPVFRVSYPNVFKAKLNKLSKKEEYNLVALFDKGADLKALEKECLRVLVEKWGDGTVVKGAPHKHGNFYFKTAKSSIAIRLPFRDQGERDNPEKGLPAGYVPGAMFMNLKSNQKPGLVDQKNQDIIDESQFYAGCYAKAAVNPFAYDQAGNRGVSFGLQAIQKVKEGEPLGNRVNPQEAFQPIEEVDSGESAESLFQ